MEPIEVVAKFRCSSETRSVGEGRSYVMHAVSDELNKQWAKWTPGGNLTITIDNPAAQIFEPGKDYLLRFSAAK